MADEQKPVMTPEQVEKLVETIKTLGQTLEAAFKLMAERLKPVVELLDKLAAQDAIYWHALPDSNALVYEHVGCDGGFTYRWIVPLDDVPLPLTSEDCECANCCLVRPLREGPVSRD
jgi:hypothetical protein